METSFTTRTAQEVLQNMEMISKRIEATQAAIKKAESEGVSLKMVSVMRQTLATLGAKMEVYNWMLVD